MRPAPARRCAAAPAHETLRAGFARRDITPPLGTPSGLSLHLPADDVWDRLTATVLVLESGRQRVAIAGLDLMGLLGATHQTLRERVAQAIDVDPELVVVNVSHTHSAPYLSAELQDLLRSHGLSLMSDAYQDAVVKAVADAAREALDRLTDVDVAVGHGTVKRVGANRRPRLADGRVVHRYGRPPEDLRALLEGLIDPDVAVLRFTLRDGSGLIGIVGVYACHPTAGGGDYHGHVSADFVGPGRSIVEARFGAPLLFLQGCGGDVGTGKWIEGTAREDTLTMGERFAAGVVDALGHARPIASPNLKLAAASLPLELDPLDAWALERELREAVERDDTAAIVATGDRLVLARRVDELRAARIVAVTLGPVALVVLPGEVFVEHGLAIRARSPFETTIVAAYNDNTLQYIPTAAAFPDGEYEVDGGWRYIRPGEGERMVDAAVDLLVRLAAPAPQVGSAASGPSGGIQPGAGAIT